MKKEDAILSRSERKRIEKLRNEIIAYIEDNSARKMFTYDDDDEEYDDYNTDEPSPIDEEPVFDNYISEHELYLLYRNAVLQNLN